MSRPRPLLANLSQRAMMEHPWRPPVPCKRWTPGRRAWVIHALLPHGFLFMEAVENCWGITVEEVTEWRARYNANGMSGLLNFGRPKRRA